MTIGRAKSENHLSHMQCVVLEVLMLAKLQEVTQRAGNDIFLGLQLKVFLNSKLKPSLRSTCVDNSTE